MNTSKPQTNRRAPIAAAIAIVSLLFALVPAAAPAFADPAPADNIVRVHLNSYGEPIQLLMGATGSYTIQDNGKALSGAFTVATAGGGLRLTNGGATYDLDGDVYIKAASLAPTNLIQINGGSRYAGDLRVYNKSGTLKLVNYTDIETYVMGVLPYEISEGWPTETLKAHAIASRTYAYYVMNSKNRAAAEHDLVNTVLHQVYYGYNSANTNCINAVNATKNMIMKTTSGGIVYACFSASNGGMTESGTASGAAASDYAYLPVKEDPYDLAFALNTTVYSAKVQVPKALSANELKTSGAQPYKMLREKLLAGGIDVARLTGDAAVKSIALTGAKSQNPARRFTGADFALSLPGIGEATASFGYATFAGSTGQYPFLNEILGVGTKFTILALRDEGAFWTLASARYGHGAGMSQVGAYQMAASGKSYIDILAFYYNVGSAASIVAMPWDSGAGTTPGAPGYTVTDAAKSGTVNTGGLVLNVRSGPATGNSVVTTLKNGTKVTINGQVADWWRIALSGGGTGFVSSAYIKLDADSAAPTAPATPTTPTTPANPATPTTQTGTVNTPAGLNVRNGAGTAYAVIGKLTHGTKVSIQSESGDWYKISYNNASSAYVNKPYIKVDGSTATTPATPTAPATKTGYVNTPGTTLNVRGGAGTAYAVVGSLKHGDKITIESESGGWCKITYGGKAAYVSKAYVKDTAPAGGTPTTQAPATKTGTVTNAPTGLNVRAGAGTNYKIIGGLKNGQTVTITAQTGSWYKIKYGTAEAYVSTAYIK